MKGLGLTLPTAIDGMDNAVNQAYSGWPDRLFVVDAEGKIAYAGGPGPRGFDVEAFGAAIKEQIEVK